MFLKWLIIQISITIKKSNVRKVYNNCYLQGPDLYAFIGFIGPDDDDIN